jgi:hypothetical protein
MHDWQHIKDAVEITLQGLTLVVLAATLWAVIRQARAFLI